MEKMEHIAEEEALELGSDVEDVLNVISATAKKHRRSLQIHGTVTHNFRKRLSSLLEEEEKDVVKAADIGRRLLTENRVLREESHEEVTTLRDKLAHTETRLAASEAMVLDLQATKRRMSKLVTETPAHPETADDSKYWKSMTTRVSNKKVSNRRKFATVGRAGAPPEPKDELDFVFKELAKKEEELKLIETQLREAAKAGMHLLHDNSLLKKANEDSEVEINRLQNERIDCGHEVPMNELRSSCRSLERRKIQLESKLKESEKENEILCDEVKELSTELEIAQRALRDAQSAGTRRPSYAQGGDTPDEQKFEELMRKMDERLKGEREKMAEVLDDVSYLQSEVDRLRQTVAADEKVIERLKGTEADARNRLALQEESVANARNSLTDKDKLVSELSGANRRFQDDLTEGQSVISALRETIDNLKEQLETKGIEDNKSMKLAKSMEMQAGGCGISQIGSDSGVGGGEVTLSTSTETTSAGTEADTSGSDLEKANDRLVLEVQELKALLDEANAYTPTAVQAAVDDLYRDFDKQREEAETKICALERKLYNSDAQYKMLEQKLRVSEEALAVEIRKHAATAEELRVALMRISELTCALKEHESRWRRRSTATSSIGTPMGTPVDVIGSLTDSLGLHTTLSSPSKPHATERMSLTTADALPRQVGFGDLPEPSHVQDDGETLLKTRERRITHTLNSLLHEKDDQRNFLQKNAEEMVQQYYNRTRKPSIQPVANLPTDINDIELRACVLYLNDALRNDPDVSVHLPIDPSGDAILKAVQDGVIVCKLVNHAVAGTIDGRVLHIRKRGESLSLRHVTENLTLGLNSAIAIGCELSNVIPQDLFDGDKDTVRQVLFAIIQLGLFSFVTVHRRGSVRRLLVDNDESRTPQDALLGWFNFQLTSAHPDWSPAVTNTGTDLTDGVALLALLKALSGEDSPMTPRGSGNASEQNIQELLGITNALGCGHFASSIAISKGLSRLNLVFIAELFARHPKLPQMQAADLKNVSDENDQIISQYIVWINSLGITPKVRSLTEDMKDGLVLLQIIAKVCPGAVDWHRVHKNPANMYKRMENCNYAVDCGHACKFSLVGISGDDIYKGNLKLTLAIVWQLRYHDLMSRLKQMCLGKEDSPLNFSQNITESDIIGWANDKILLNGSKIQISSFRDSSIKDSTFLADLLNSVELGCVDAACMTVGGTEDECIQNARYVISIARMIGCMVLLQPEHIVKQHAQQLLVFVGTLMTHNSYRARNSLIPELADE